MITLYGIPKSRSLRVSWLLEELELNWHYHFVDFAKGVQKSPEYLSINPCGKVPALQDNDLVMTESMAIMLYLAEKYGQGNWLPVAGTPESAMHHRWMSFISCELEQPLWTMGKHKFALPPELRHREMLAVAKWEFDRAAEVAETWMAETDFLLGDKPHVADILLAQTLIWASRFEMSLPPKLNAFMVRMGQRPAMKQALDKEIAGAQVSL